MTRNQRINQRITQTHHIMNKRPLRPLLTRDAVGRALAWTSFFPVISLFISRFHLLFVSNIFLLSFDSISFIPFLFIFILKSPPLSFSFSRCLPLSYVPFSRSFIFFRCIRSLFPLPLSRNK